MKLLLIVVLALLLFGAFPVWPYSADWGYYPSSGVGVLLVLVILLALVGKRV